MILSMAKYLFVGAKDDIDTFFHEAQKFGWIEFIGSDQPSHTMPKYIEDLMKAMKILRHWPQGDKKISKECSSSEIVEKVLNSQNSLEAAEEQLRYTKAEIARITPFGHFSMDDIAALQANINRKMHFYTIKHTKDAQHLPEDLIYINTDHDLDYFISFTSDPIEFENLVYMPIKDSLKDLKEKLRLLQTKIQDLHHELIDLTIYLPFLKNALIDHLNHVNLKLAKEDVSFTIHKKIFSIQAWIPKEKLKQLQQITEPFSIFIEEIAEESFDRKPTAMENKGVGAIGEDLVHIYDVPSNNDKDPSTWVYVSFAIFFAMIIADAGYGLIYLALAIFLKCKFPKAVGLKKRFINLILTLAITCTIWGCLTTSFFSIDFSPKNPISRFSMLGYLSEKKAEYHITQKDDVYDYWTEVYPKLKNVKNPNTFLQEGARIKEGKLTYEIQKAFEDNILMEISLIVGIIHVALGLIRNLRRSWAGIGWAAFMIGGYLFFPKILDATSIVNFVGIISKKTSYIAGEQLLYTGIGLSIVLAFIQNKLKGATEILKMIEVFADVLSYLRLYALGLASMILASTFNDLGKEAGLFFGILIILVGHVTNMTLGIMGGVIHGLRLNFLEWYHHCFEGGGRKFSPLKLLTRS